VAEAYVVGLQWVLHYYYDGVVSWSWFYPYHYPPMISDLVRLDQVKIAFEPGAPPTGATGRVLLQTLTCMCARTGMGIFSSFRRTFPAV